MTWFMILAALLAAGLLHAYRLALPPRPDLVREISARNSARARANRREAQVSDPGSALDRIVRRLVDELTRRGRDLTGLRQDLEVTGSTLEAYLSRALALVVVGLIAPNVIVAILALLAAPLPARYGFMAGLALGGAMVLVTRKELHENATARRAEMRRALSIYLDLVAMSLEAGRGHHEALPAAARIGSGWAFTELQDATVEAPRWEGITPWAALGRLGQRFGMSELTELEGTLSLAQEDGAKVKASLVARAKTLRAQRVADTEAKSNQATESMKFALIVLAFAFLTYEFYPLVARLFSG